MLYDILTQIVSKLESVGAKSVAIGIEDGLSADDTPWIRVVPTEEETSDFAKDTLSFEVYIGTDIRDNMAQTYQEHMDFIEKIKSTLRFTQYSDGVCYYTATKFDKDIVKNFKVAMLQFQIKGIR